MLLNNLKCLKNKKRENVELKHRQTMEKKKKTEKRVKDILATMKSSS